MNAGYNECGREFQITLKKQKHPKEIIETYFVCPYCNTRYSSGFTDPRVRKCHGLIRKLYKQIEGSSNLKLVEVNQAKIDKLTRESRERTEKLKL